MSCVLAALVFQSVAMRISSSGVSPLFKPVLPSEPAPRYRQARRALQKAIEAGHFRDGRALPSEAVIAKSLQVSIGTLRRAVDELVHEHVLVRRQGQGTFVAPHSPARFMFQFFPVEPRKSEKGAAPGAVATATHQPLEYPAIECLSFAGGQADRRTAEALRIRSGAAVFMIENRLRLGGQPVVYDRIVLAATPFKGLTETAFVQRPGTIYGLYQTGFGITVLHTRERARAVLADAKGARVLGIEAGAPVMEIHRLALTFGDQPVEYRISVVNTEAHDYVHAQSKLPR
jgi:GntR family transcriptional regulator